MNAAGIRRRRAFWAFFRNEFYNVSAYKASFWMRMVYNMLMMYSVGYVWRALYASGAGNASVPLPLMITYAVLGIVLESVMHPGNGPQTYMAGQVRSGAIEMDILKPMDFQFQMLAKNMSSMLVRVGILVAPSLVLAGFLFGLQRPTALGLTGCVISLCLGMGVGFMLNFMLGLTGMLTMHIRNINWGYNATVRFFSGQMVPLWIFPGALSAAADLLPFRCLYAIPMTIYIGEAAGTDMLALLGIQVAWLAVLFVCSRLLMRHVCEKLMIQGG